MRTSMKLIVLLGMLSFFTPTFGATKPSPASAARPQGTVYLADWAEKNGFKMKYNPKTLAINLTNRWSDIDLLANSKRGSINGVSVFLSFPIRVSAGRFLVYQKDLSTLFEPILYPKRLPANVKIRSVALDPGHGGRDPGYQVGNQQEKKYTLLLAREVQEQLERAGIKTMLTRRSDTYVERDQRAELARKAKADLFVSLHYNAAADTSASGVETYAVTPYGAEATNGGETSLLRYPGNKFEQQSILLAYELQRSMTRGLDAADRGVRRAGFEVLRKAPMPAILVECGFISNNADAKKVYDEKHRQEMARAIVDGILSYKRIMQRSTLPK
jgi:N-acetylmuramoyl-L-alanine amidase